MGVYGRMQEKKGIMQPAPDGPDIQCVMPGSGAPVMTRFDPCTDPRAYGDPNTCPGNPDPALFGAGIRRHRRPSAPIAGIARRSRTDRIRRLRCRLQRL